VPEPRRRAQTEKGVACVVHGTARYATIDDMSGSIAPEPATMFDLTGRVAVLTGASSGLGERFTRVLHAAGVQVVAVARRADRLSALAAELDGLVTVTADVTDEQAMKDLVDSTVRRFGRIDILVNNAGAADPMSAVDEPLAVFRAKLELNLVSVFNLSRLVAVPMLAAGKGAIINIASVYGLGSSWPMHNASYTASKGGVVQLTRELGCHWCDKGVRVNAIAPGFFLTEATAGMDTDDRSVAYIQRNAPMRRMGQAHELDGALVYLVSDASSYVTGHVLTVDGGWTAH
jgi:NAD(P)-dependent dehydrogenase (short-subunit alcohol dehydrogenase family)